MSNPTTPPTRPELEEIRERLAKATSGPWEWWAPDESLTEQGVMTHAHPDIQRDQSGNIVHAVTICRGMTGPARAENADLIAHAPTDLAYLLARCDALEKLRAKIEALPTYDEYSDWVGGGVQRRDDEYGDYVNRYALLELFTPGAPDA